MFTLVDIIPKQVYLTGYADQRMTHVAVLPVPKVPRPSAAGCLTEEQLPSVSCFSFFHSFERCIFSFFCDGGRAFCASVAGMDGVAP